ncbi:hypothetical protein M5K25_024498 [Dendrobium thyrsiflorum]|uniref:Uncharacterized protein n=1 Tax=Dendrobium thyrsiflorum TaxID=117978 RepID=A0ABD0U267_DENTH
MRQSSGRSEQASAGFGRRRRPKLDPAGSRSDVDCRPAAGQRVDDEGRRQVWESWPGSAWLACVGVRSEAKTARSSAWSELSRNGWQVDLFPGLRLECQGSDLQQINPVWDGVPNP